MEVTEKDMLSFVEAVESSSSYDFSDYSDKSLKRRVERLLVEYRVNVQGLIYKIEHNQEFLETIVKEITVNTTDLFRDPEVWHEIRQRVINKLKDKPEIRIWHAGCSTGQEVYSLAIMLKELNLFDKCRIFASDLNTDVLDRAKEAEYKYRFNINYLSNFDIVLKEDPYNYTIEKEVDYNTYFKIDKKNDKIVMNDFLRKKPLFRKMDLVKLENSFMTKFDLILCRNVLIYFNLPLQNKVIDFFHENLNDGGFLVLGKHESLLGYPESNFDKKGKFYQKR